MNTKIDFIQASLIAITSALAAYFDSTITYLAALIVAFSFNILAGFRADEVHIVLQRIYPPIILKNFQGNKLKDSLVELLLITTVVYLLKLLADLMKYNSQSAYIVQFLIFIAIYHYLRKGLGNLKDSYPKIKFITVVYYLLSFKFREMFGKEVADIMDSEEGKEAVK